MKTETLAKLACAYSGLVWGLFWIPIRALDDAGIEGLWATFYFYAVPLRPEPARCSSSDGVRPSRAASGCSSWASCRHSSLVLYSVSVLYTDVVRATLLFYLTPLWSTLLARIFLGEPITPLRWLAMAVGLLGMLVIFHADTGIPLPEQPGDWIALASGFLWSVASILLRADKGSAPSISSSRISSGRPWSHRRFCLLFEPGSFNLPTGRGLSRAIALADADDRHRGDDRRLCLDVGHAQAQSRPGRSPVHDRDQRRRHHRCRVVGRSLRLARGDRHHPDFSAGIMESLWELWRGRAAARTPIEPIPSAVLA